MAKEIKVFIKKECKAKNHDYYDEWIRHFNLVEKYGEKLASDLNANKEVVILAAWLHDIGSIINEKENHHINGAEIAEKKLKELEYPREKIEKVKHCIISHRASQKISRETIEAQILADADSMAHFDNIDDLLKAELVFRCISGLQAKERVKQKLVRSWNKLSSNAKDMVENKYPNLVVSLK